METSRSGRFVLSRRDDSDEQRNVVLKKSHLNGVVFERDGEQKIRLKRIVSVDKETISIFTTVTIYDRRVTEDEFEKIHAAQEKVSSSEEREDKNRMEKVEQAAYYNSKMVRLTRDVVLDRRFLDKEWMTRHTKAYIEGFPTRNGFNESFGLIKTSSESTSMKSSGYRNTTSLIFTFDGSIQESSLVAQQQPILGREYSIQLERRVEKVGASLELLLDTRLMPNLYKLDCGWVEETCEYLVDPSKRELTELEVMFRQSPGFQHIPRGTVIFWSEPSRNNNNNSVYSTPLSHEIPRQNTTSSEMNPVCSKIPSELFYDLIAEEEKTAAKKINVRVSDQDEPLAQMEILEPGGGQKHNLLLTAEIDGKAQAFVGSLAYCGPDKFVPKRVIVDGSCVWQQSNDWKPSGPVKKIEIDLRLGDKK